jgi:signal transduction histidine kinase
MLCRSSSMSILDRESGCGIAAEQLPHLFERFYRVDTSRSRMICRSGLGLSICRNLVESHGGSVSCESIVGAGTTFIVQLPLVGTSIVKIAEKISFS